MATTPAQASAKIQAAQDVANAASSAAHPTAASGRDTLPAGIGYQTYNPDGSVRTSQTAAQKSASDASDIASGKDTPVGVAGTLNTGVPSTPITPPATPANTPVTTTQPSPTTANATPYTNPTGSVPIAAPQTPTEQAHAIATASGGPAPQNAGVGMSVANNAIKTATGPDTSGVNNFLATNKEADPIRQILAQVAEIQNSQKNSSTLLEDYKALYANSNLDNINAELIHADTVINGTEQDIRNEIQTAGGMGTESQIQAMTLARNKPLLQRYNQLAQMKTDATNQLNTMMSLDGQDKQMAQQRVNTQIDTLYKSADLVMSMQNAARTQATQLMSMVGADGLYAALKSDPNKLAYVEQQVGGSTGWMAQAATQAAQSRSLDVQMKQANIAQSNAAVANSYSNIAKNNADIANEAVAKANALTAHAASADNTLTAVNTALKQVNPLSSGTVGGYSTLIPGSPSKNLESTLKTVQSALALDQLQQLKANAPNGASGLGAASDREGDWLASNVANLDVGQSTGQLKTNLGLVKTHYINYLTSLGYGYDEKTGTVIAP